MYADVAPATAKISTGWATGSGFFVEDGTRVITNAHVVNGQRDLLTVTSFTGESYKARIEKLDDINDLAVLRLEGNAHNGKSIKLGAGSTMHNGDALYVLGHPEGRSDTYISPGTFDSRYPLTDIGKGIPVPPDAPKGMEEDLKKAGAKYGPASQHDLDDYVHSDRIDMYAHGRPGNSGSAVVDKNGDLIAVLANGATVDQLKERSWSVPSEKVQALLDPSSHKFDFNYQEVSAFHESPILTSVLTGGVGALSLGLPRVGGSIIGGLSLLTAPSEVHDFLNAKDGNQKLYSGLNLLSDAGFIAGAVLSFFPATRTASRIATITGITGLVGSGFVPHFPYLTDIHRTNGDSRLPFLWED